jgi:hypothetical protein
MAIDCHLDGMAIEVLEHVDPLLGREDTLNTFDPFVVDLCIRRSQKREQKERCDEHVDSIPCGRMGKPVDHSDGAEGDNYGNNAAHPSLKSHRCKPHIHADLPVFVHDLLLIHDVGLDSLLCLFYCRLQSLEGRRVSLGQNFNPVIDLLLPQAKLEVL